ncbi:hypothetical protein M2451_003354 [Dysgonomonas sp. PFB1-18]|uniref:hypothetical protein n=1 Tax=unclassified Dysgonomonas TaxID=2630389 RepID=UPI0024748DF1|nr:MULTISPECIES: hypothetical protein [unclassified Dysgonomonas]MDH6310556.1 hypothetical protein [Dysgonomonas sp. PF1-14]MDH6340406.1 hypothetical protein [Dysgonomonas sp. PF1-16]MDH6382014.1 hypothetical protein [Dysgonomonas sp. PFB1-18]MDH6399377.1 hypothetical protein [Dysgonomonas sp. PF1-23]
MNQIIVPHGTNVKLQEIFKLSHVAINLALKGKYKGRVSEDKAKRIREAAKKNGGWEVVKVENEKSRTL